MFLAEVEHRKAKNIFTDCYPCTDKEDQGAANNPRRNHLLVKLEVVHIYWVAEIGKFFKMLVKINSSAD
jgi:hypothetical protein